MIYKVVRGMVAVLLGAVIVMGMVVVVLADAETLSPDAILDISELAPNDVSYIQDDPDSPDSDWLVASGNNTDTYVWVSFPTPSGDPTVGADLQEFRALVRQYDEGQGGTPDARIELWENGGLVRAGSDTPVPHGGVVLSFTWNANELGTADGSLVECRVYGGKSGGSPSNRNTVDVGAIEWNVDYTAPIVVPTVTTAIATNIEDTTATGNGNITDKGGENCDHRGVVWDDGSHGDPGDTAPDASDYVTAGGGYTDEAGDFDTGEFTASMTGLPTGTTVYYRAWAHNSAGYAYGGEQSFLTKPAAPTNVAATDGAHTDKVVVTWTKSTGATTEPYNDTDGVVDPDGRFYQCVLNATGATEQTSTTDRGYKSSAPVGSKILLWASPLILLLVYRRKKEQRWKGV